MVIGHKQLTPENKNSGQFDSSGNLSVVNID